MTGLLEDALRRVESLPDERQDAIAAQILENLDDDDAWTLSLERNPSTLALMAREALDEHRRGETRSHDELFR